MSRREHEHDTPPDAAVTAELAALDAVLAGEPPTGALEAELAALVDEVRAQAPSMPLALRERLDRSVSEGFLEHRARARFPRPSLGKALLVATGLAVVLVAFVAVAVRTEQTQDISTFSSRGPALEESPDAAGSSDSATSADSAAPESAAKSGSGASSSTVAGAAPAPGREAAPGAARKVERAVDLSLRVGLGKIQDASDGVVRVTQGVGGYVRDSQVSARGGHGDATFTLRVPTARLDDAIAQLSRLGHVASLDQRSKDITSAFTSVGDRLSDARAERRALVRALGKAQTAGEIAALRERIRGNRADLATLTAELKRLRGRADTATIAMTVTASRTGGGGAAGADDSGGDWTPGDAAGDALRVLKVVAGVLIVATAVLVPLGAVAALALWLGRVTRRRRREHALDRA